jgi:hypothetical protein
MIASMLGTRSVFVLALAATACAGEVAPTESDEGAVAPTTPTPTQEVSPAPCTVSELDGTYNRQLTPEDAAASDLIGAWVLEIDGCEYRISLDGIEQGAGRIELVDGVARSGRVALSEDLGCPNEFTGSGFYDITLDGGNLTFSEAIAATDQCEGRAGAFVGAPSWERS